MITIVVPIYNVEKYLKDCLDSILKQSFQNLEVILVDDKSTDGSLKIAIDYVNKYNFKLIKKTNNEGLSEARNSALKIACGDFIMFLDSDDIIHPKTCEILFEAWSKFDSDIISFRNFRFLNKFEFESIDSVSVDNVTPLEELKYGIMACARLYKIELFDGVTFPKGMLSEDTATVPILLSKAKVLTTINIKLYGYRLPRGNSLTSNEEKLMKDSPQAIRILLNVQGVNCDVIEYLTLKTFITLIRRFIINRNMWKRELDEFININNDLVSILIGDCKNEKYPFTKKDKKYASSFIRYINGGGALSLYPFYLSWIGKRLKGK